MATDTNEYNPAVLYAKMAAIMGGIQRIKKGGTNKEQGYKFVQDADVLDIVREQLAEKNIAFFARMINVRQEIIGQTQRGTSIWHTVADFEFTFACGDTGCTFTSMWSGESLEWSDKGISKAATSAEKYFLLKTFMMSTGDDPDATTPPPPRTPQKQQPTPARPPAPAPEEPKAQQQPAAEKPATPKNPPPAAPAQQATNGSYKASIGVVFNAVRSLYDNHKHMQNSVSKLEELGTLKPEMTADQAIAVIKQHKAAQQPAPDMPPASPEWNALEADLDGTKDIPF